ncbi:peptide chain release factor 3 [Rhodospirillaceae bacterium KN72]|uniref:Peptide chain release factor 3 n=1 Tax=Pacificispira spongiicola TaxID=2729598 RepID=A0A7Y0HI05_9PROT|nr:peptide chain release factor 3 [Pacificispira spongiicola]NMM46014.1 peptide chain release factor 3 [Pacificispira spongiicola]
MPTTEQAVRDRRTFAIISHPDAGKTTLTEKLLLRGGAIHLAGEVKAKGERRRARSDWMKIEQQRGISVTTSVMTFIRDGITFNLLDTPGHEDFSEDTYRTLTAVDSAVMVIDAAKGIEPQTRKLFEVCRLRDMPIVTFINKLDREARDPFELMDQIAEELALDVAPVAWPIGMGRDFKGCYDLLHDRVLLMGEDRTESVQVDGLDDPKLEELIPAEQLQKLREEAELVREACPKFDVDAFLEGHMTPVYFGSALRNFGVGHLLSGIAEFSPPPRPLPTDKRSVDPTEDKVSGFVFKVQANMDPNHRDRIAFVRMCSGKFKRGMKLKHVRSGKPMAIYNPIMFFAQDREIADEAFPGDIVGVPNHGTLRVGDTLSESEDMRFTGIPDFAPEILRRVRLDDPMKGKHLKKALESLAEEGVTQVFKPELGANWIVGVVGQLQLDVLKTRIEAEYGINVTLEPAPYETARWVSCDDKAKLDSFCGAIRSAMSTDRDGAPVFLARNYWELNHQIQNNPDIRFSKTRERA